MNILQPPLPMRQLKITSRITSRESLSLDKYLNEISKIDMLSSEEEAALARRIKEGDEEALEKLTTANLRFVVSVAKNYQNQGLSLTDLINEGNVGLIKAARRFDETRGFKFISYAVWWIRQSILHAIVENARIVRMPINKVASYNKVNQAYAKFIQKHEREPSYDELAEILDIKPSEVAAIMRSGRHISMDAPLGRSEDGDGTLLDVLASDESLSPDLKVVTEARRQEIMNSLRVLSPRERDIIITYFGLATGKPLNLHEVGDRFGLTRERTRQIKDRALRRLRKVYNRRSLNHLLEL